MFTNIDKPDEEKKDFAPADLLDKKIEVSENRDSDKNYHTPKFVQGLLSIASATIFNKDECAKIINSCIDEIWTPIKIYGSGDIHRATTQKARGNLSESPFHLIREAIVTANSEIYKFDLLGIVDTDYPQVSRYQKDDFYDLHSEMNPMSSTRKLSFLIMLNDKFDYEGGEIEFLNTELSHEETSSIGTMLVFPSFLCYKIKPITKGTRYLLTGHVHGDSFK